MAQSGTGRTVPTSVRRTRTAATDSGWFRTAQTELEALSPSLFRDGGPGAAKRWSV